MPAVVGVRFKPVTKIYYFMPPQDATVVYGDPVIVETARGKELAWIAMTTKDVPHSEVKGTLKRVVRRATPVDLMKRSDFAQKHELTIQICKEKVAELNLPMKIVDAEYSYDGSRVLISFGSEQRVDFRDLVRVLVKTLRTRVEMRQIGARDEAKIIDGYGRCGRQLCCSSWLTEFHPVSIRMAKNQRLPLAPAEISGVCGRLLCCLAYEDKMYSEMKKGLPKIGATVETEAGVGIIKGLNILKQSVIVEIPDVDGRKEVSVEAVTVVDASRLRRVRDQQKPIRKEDRKREAATSNSRAKPVTNDRKPSPKTTQKSSETGAKKSEKREAKPDNKNPPKRKRRRSRRKKGKTPPPANTNAKE